ncbi:DUF1513 domain-containing protein [Sulfitobacter geojensis]|uniref:DUF1513 domain-containing protein n=1 Tax=Sulfitobacter geojensis TaxID=1342299 RepID=UPI0007D9633C|nr:DUF1513 domain-containing protein [Sulfitobacter geojensis]OAN87096.1 twin-arginine translocation pathway signal [Sulfitobacter geojensis]
MRTRRGFIASVLATASLPALTWADVGGPSYLAAARAGDGGFVLCGLTPTGQETFRIALPDRAHAGAPHPKYPEAVVFARRPGTFALVIDCVSGRVAQDLMAPQGQHFTGHGVFAQDGETLFTGEINNATGAGSIGVWARAEGYRRVGQFASGGIGPHEILRLPEQDVLVVANGGIIAALDDKRTKLNIDEMRPNLTYVSATGEIIDQMTLPPELHKSSIRHLAVSNRGQVAFAMQWEGEEGASTPLVGLHQSGQAARLLDVPTAVSYQMAGYVGSIACAKDDGGIAVSCPKGNLLVLFSTTGDFITAVQRPDVCGLAAANGRFIATDGFGGISSVTDQGIRPLRQGNLAWDNHLIAI